jgi:hypothetical protein
MKRRNYLILFITALTTVITAQENRNQPVLECNCEIFSTMVDSIYVYNWTKTTSQWDFVTIWQYENSGGRHDRLLFINAKNRIPNQSWEYYYDVNGNKYYDFSMIWRENQWLTYIKKESEFNELNQETHQLTSTWKKGKWVFNSFHYNEYSEGKLVKVIYQALNPDSSIYDVSYSEYSYENNILAEVTGFKSSDGTVYVINKYSYNDDGTLAEMLILVPDPEQQGRVKYLPSKRRVYNYDDYSLLREVLFQDWNGTEWEMTSKYQYFYKFDNAQKVLICHNNHEICVSVNALKAHLAHGDYFGRCLREESEFIKDDSKNQMKKDPFTVFPNPATDQVTVKFNDQEDSRTRIELVDSFGKLLRAYDTNNNSEVVINRGNLKNGQYYLRVSGETVYSTLIIFR